MSRTPRSHTRVHTKRHGQHHKRTSKYVKVYAPYLPLVVSIIASVFLNFWQPSSGMTLAYATSMSSGGLLSATNSQRAGNGKAALGINSKLSSAAQAKANDMVARDYWSHTTPDGKEPWVFIQAAGYDYTKAGENLAYGFATSPDAVAGWMNSAAHKANMLDSTFTEVGFGYANSTGFNGDGKQTVVVAMYGQPQVLAATQSPPAPASTAPSTQSSPPAPTPAPKKQAAPAKKEEPKPANPLPITTEQPIAAAAPTSQNIAKAQTLTNGRAPWALTAAVLLTGFALVALLLHHSLKARHLVHDLIHDTERFVLHHPLLESTLLGLVVLGTVLSRTVGTIL
ncbi:MAG TPA: CAP domain-containing protein [Candidatus Limnocylindria bacterium]|nr:CAP domain-containing protein [Candidatus Limnocylindria bacterium]